MTDHERALRDLTASATIYLTAVDAPDVLDHTTPEQARNDLLYAVERAEATFDQPPRPATTTHPRRRRR
ncbi:hypothetical protein GKE82_25280 [Conexibacter sp. W3-3-2]|uniref:hypothetical protein n=1 Tax=Conexibacter sp. W3-3-2 TaxID=2675227 RepID=UPI0012B73C38|nr:hypothetical protein [Conexibacter sp. W3-3-2]MTD47520.1 hypothetical protein [Conexibacter sp. W3-3-2]